MALFLQNPRTGERLLLRVHVVLVLLGPFQFPLNYKETYSLSDAKVDSADVCKIAIPPLEVHCLQLRALSSIRI